MAKCMRCKRGGLFRKLDSDGHCVKCAVAVLKERNRMRAKQINEPMPTSASKPSAACSIVEPSIARQDQTNLLVNASGLSLGEKPLAHELIFNAIDLIFAQEQASISLLQRRLRVGYASAARMIDALASAGIISQGEGAKPRAVNSNITAEQAKQMLISQPPVAQHASSSPVINPRLQDYIAARPIEARSHLLVLLTNSLRHILHKKILIEEQYKIVEQNLLRSETFSYLHDLEDAICACQNASLPVLLTTFDTIREIFSELSAPRHQEFIKDKIGFSTWEQEFNSQKVDLVNACVGREFSVALEGRQHSTAMPTIMRRANSYFAGLLTRYGKQLPQESIRDIYKLMEDFGVNMDRFPPPDAWTSLSEFEK